MCVQCSDSEFGSYAMSMAVDRDAGPMMKIHLFTAKPAVRRHCLLCSTELSPGTRDRGSCT